MVFKSNKMVFETITEVFGEEYSRILGKNLCICGKYTVFWGARTMVFRSNLVVFGVIFFIVFLDQTCGILGKYTCKLGKYIGVLGKSYVYGASAFMLSL